MAIWNKKLLIASLHELRHIDIEDEFQQTAAKFDRKKTFRRKFREDQGIVETEKNRSEFHVIKMKPHWRIHTIQDAYNSSTAQRGGCTLLCEDENDCQLVFFTIKELNKDRA